MHKNYSFIWPVVFTWIVLSGCNGKADPVETGSRDSSRPGNPAEVSPYLSAARETHDFIVTNYLTPYHSFRVNTTTNRGSAFEWYNVSQIYADAAMVRIGDSSYLPEMKATFMWMKNLWDKQDTYGGYFSFADTDGKGASGAKYVDDNALTGVAFLAAYDVAGDSDKAAYLAAAEKCAGWIIHSGLWDDQLGGGFWWNTDKTVKPTQSNGLALQLFLRLYKITGQTEYRDRAVSVNDWLNKKMYNKANGLYIWQMEKSGRVDSQNFTYDNAIMVEADLLFAGIMQDHSYLNKAKALGKAMTARLWNGSHNVFIFNTADRRINPTYCGWASQAMISLYRADKRADWLGYAKGNIDAINTVLRDPASYGYYQYAGLDGAGRYTNMEGVDQAWMQRVQALLSVYR